MGAAKVTQDTTVVLFVAWLPACPSARDEGAAERPLSAASGNRQAGAAGLHVVSYQPLLDNCVCVSGRIKRCAFCSFLVILGALVVLCYRYYGDYCNASSISSLRQAVTAINLYPKVNRKCG